MIIESFLRWAETAKAGERARAANALGRAWAQFAIGGNEREVALTAMTWLLDDPSPKVRLALAEAIADAEDIPRTVVLPLAQDQPQIAAQIIARSPVLTDMDLVDLAARGDSVTRVLIACRFIVSLPVSAAIAEVGDEPEIEALLNNPGALVSGNALRRIAERFSHAPELRELLVCREELPSDARHLLTLQVADELADCPLVQFAVGPRRYDHIRAEACERATVTLAAEARAVELPQFVEHLRASGRLTPSVLMHALCAGKLDFFIEAMVSLSGLAERRVRSIVSDGRFHAMRALYESAGLARELSEVFVEATLLWRGSERGTASGMAARLMSRFRNSQRSASPASELLDMVERLQIVEQRQSARAYASFLALEAA